MILSRLYPIADASCFSDTAVLLAFAEELVAGGVTLLQYRNKTGNARQMLDQARELKLRIGVRARLIMNDRADLCLAAGFDGVHVGQDDISPEGARKVIGPNYGWESPPTIPTRFPKLNEARQTTWPSAQSSSLRVKRNPIQ